MQNLLANRDVDGCSDSEGDAAGGPGITTRHGPRRARVGGAERQAGVGKAGVVEEAECGEEGGGDVDLLRGLDPGVARTCRGLTM